MATINVTALQHDIAITKVEFYKYKEIKQTESIQLKEFKEAVQQLIPKNDVAVNCPGSNSIISNNKQNYSKAVTNNLLNNTHYEKSNKSLEFNIDLKKNK